jgi:hypothetical protein
MLLRGEREKSGAGLGKFIYIGSFYPARFFDLFCSVQRFTAQLLCPDIVLGKHCQQKGKTFDKNSDLDYSENIKTKEHE